MFFIFKIKLLRNVLSEYKSVLLKKNVNYILIKIVEFYICSSFRFTLGFDIRTQFVLLDFLLEGTDLPFFQKPFRFVEC